MIVRMLGPAKDPNRLRVRALTGTLRAEVTESGSARLAMLLENATMVILALDSPEDLLRLARQAIAAAEGHQRDLQLRWDHEVRDLTRRASSKRERAPSRSGKRRKGKAQGRQRRGR